MREKYLVVTSKEDNEQCIHHYKKGEVVVKVRELGRADKAAIYSPVNFSNQTQVLDADDVVLIEDEKGRKL